MKMTFMLGLQKSYRPSPPNMLKIASMWSLKLASCSWKLSYSSAVARPCTASITCRQSPLSGLVS